MPICRLDDVPMGELNLNLALTMQDYPKDNLIVALTLEFAIEIVKYCDILEERRKYVIVRQLLKSGTSIGANVREAQNAESKSDFIHKFKIPAKEA